MAEKIRLTFLGTSDSIPSVDRNHPAFLLSYKDENILVDCGEGTQRQFRKAKLSPMKINMLLITHWHGDHVLGIPGLLQTLALNGYSKTLHVYGPAGTKKYMKQLLKTFAFSGKISMDVKEIRSGKFYEGKDFYLMAQSMKHGTPCLAYSFVRKGQIRIDREKLNKTDLPHGPLMKQLAVGKNVTYEGKKYSAKKLTYRDEDLKISFVLDTMMNDRIAPFVQGSNLLICESSFSADMKDKAREHKHLTSEQAAKIAKRGKVARLYLTHVSQRYSKNPSEILKEAKKVFKNAHLAKDFDVVEV